MCFRRTGLSPTQHCLLAILGTFGLLLGPSAVAAQRPVQPRRINIDSVSSAQFRAYIGDLRFATDTEAGDRQALLVGHYPDSASYGPLATILPERNAHLGSVEQLRFGKIIARITNESADSYPKLGLLPHAVTYWWVEYNERAESGRSVFVTVDSGGNIIGRTVSGLTIMRYHRGGFRVNQPLARFVWTNDDELAWGSCNGVCCKQVS
jgi:hypothetical protein